MASEADRLSRPLDGLTVVTLEHAVAAPFATRQLYRTAGFLEEWLDEDGEMIADLVLPRG